MGFRAFGGFSLSLNANPKTMRRYLIGILLALLCAFGACSRQDPVPAQPVLQDGEWTGTGEGRSGTILIKMTVREHRITDIVVVSQSESSFAQEAIREMIARAIQKQAILGDVDAVSGATLTSNGVIEAVNMARCHRSRWSGALRCR